MDNYKEYEMISINNASRIAVQATQTAQKAVKEDAAEGGSFDEVLFSEEAKKYLGGKDIHLDVMNNDDLKDYSNGSLAKLLESGDIKLAEYSNELFKRGNGK